MQDARQIVDEAAYLVIEFVEGITMAELDTEQRKIVEIELEGHLETMRNLKSRIWGGPSGIVCEPLFHKIVRL